MGESITCYTYNVNGIGDEIKRREIFHYLHKKGPDIMFLQEVHSVPAVEKYWNTEWGSRLFYCHGESNARGVIIVFNRKLNVLVHNIYRDCRGRFLLMYVTINGLKIGLANVYAPNQDDPIFFQDIFREINRVSPDHFIIAGDLNLALNKWLDRSGRGSNNDHAAEWLNTHFSCDNWVDVWREIHADRPGFTWRRMAPFPTFSRLDYFILKDFSLQLVQKIDTIPGFKSDHTIVKLVICLQYADRGPGYWKFNTSLLKDKDYLDRINDLIDIELESDDLVSYKNKWEQLKLSIRGSTIQYASRKSKAQNNALQALERKLKHLEAELLNNCMLFQDTHEQILLVKKDISDLQRIKTKGAILRSRAKWLTEGERPTKYFLSLEKNNYKRKTLFKLADQNGLIVEQPNQILDEIRTFYDNLYTSRQYVDLSYLDKLEIPQLPEQIKMELDSPISICEIADAIKQMNNNKCPGLDGLPVDFYKVFWPKLKSILPSVYEEVVQSGMFHFSARQSVISLLEKTGKNPLYLNSWRPLSLLNVDNKIYGKVLANRLQKGLEVLVHSSQTGFIKGRHLSENILRILKVVQHSNDSAENNFLVSFDFRKAFDYLEFSSIFATLSKFGFGEKYIELVRPMFNSPVSYASNNGYLSRSFFPTRGCRQGCTYSPGIFVLTVETLGLGIRQNTDIEGVIINKKEIKSGQFADDLWATLKNVESINAILRELEYFQTFSGLTINAEKCCVVKLGPHSNTNARYYTLKRLYWSPSVTILGIVITTNAKDLYDLNFAPLLIKSENILFNWSHRNLTLFGKISVINSLVNTLFIHKLLALPTPPDIFFSKYKAMVRDFLWNNTSSKVAYDKLIQNYDRLGLKLIDLKLKEVALKAMWPVRWRERDEEELMWVYSEFPPASDSVWNCNISCKDVERLTHRDALNPLPSIWKAWARFSYNPDISLYDDIIHQNIMCNSHIRIAHKPITSKIYLNSGIGCILDVIHPEAKRFYDYNEARRYIPTFSLDMVSYYALLASIPRLWRIEIRANSLTEATDYLTALDTLLLRPFPSRQIYWQLVSITYPPKLAVKTVWELELNKQIPESVWWDLYPNILFQVKVTKLQCLQYRILTRSLTTNVRRNKWDPTVSPLCSFCLLFPETLEHLFVNCEKTNVIWLCLKRLLKYFIDIDLELSSETILLNNYQGICNILVNTLILICKQYIYSNKCLGNPLSFDHCMAKIGEWYQIEKYVVYTKNNVNITRSFHQKWDLIFPSNV